MRDEPNLISKLKRLQRKWRRNSESYQLSMLQERKLGDNDASLNAARYEGEHYALLWCASDLEEVL